MESCELMQPKLFKSFSCIKQKHVVLWTDFVIFSLSVLPFIFEYIISHVLTTLSKWKWVWYWVYNFLVIWLWFKAENICDIWILMYNLLHFPFEGFYSLVGKNPNLLLLRLRACFWSSMTHRWKLFALTSHYIIFFLSLPLYSVRTM